MTFATIGLFNRRPRQQQQPQQLMQRHGQIYNTLEDTTDTHRLTNENYYNCTIKNEIASCNKFYHTSRPYGDDKLTGKVSQDDYYVAKNIYMPKICKIARNNDKVWCSNKIESGCKSVDSCNMNRKGLTDWERTDLLKEVRADRQSVYLPQRMWEKIPFQ